MKTSRRIPFQNRRGFSLTELLVCLSMFSVAGLLAMRLFGQSMHVIQASAQDPTFQLEQMGQALRIDAWGARRIEIADGKAADITTSDGKQIQWRWDQQQITRDEIAAGATGTTSRQWTTPVQFTAERADRALVLRTRSDQWRFTAPMLSEGSP